MVLSWASVINTLWQYPKLFLNNFLAFFSLQMPVFIAWTWFIILSMIKQLFYHCAATAALQVINDLVEFYTAISFDCKFVGTMAGVNWLLVDKLSHTGICILIIFLSPSAYFVAYAWILNLRFVFYHCATFSNNSADFLTIVSYDPKFFITIAQVN